MTDPLTATEIGYRKHIAIAANGISDFRATDIDRLVIELPKEFSSASFLRWLLEHDDLSKRARGEATALLRFAEPQPNKETTPNDQHRDDDPERNH